MNENMQNLVVEEGETLNLSPDSGRFKTFVKQFRPQSIEEVRKILGGSSQLKKPDDHTACCIPEELKSTMVSPDDLDSEDRDTMHKANRLTYSAARYYVQAANVSALSHWTATLNKFIQKNKAVLNVFEFGDIDVNNGATLNIARNGHALYANAIRLHGNGKIVCKGPTTFRSTSFEGKISTLISDTFFFGKIISSLTK